MEWLRLLLKNKSHVVLSAPALLCFITFCTNLYSALSDGKIDSNEFSALLSTADGFESVVLFVLIMVLKDKNK